jgi:hypothetical protein
MVGNIAYLVFHHETIVYQDNEPLDLLSNAGLNGRVLGSALLKT